MEATSKSDKVTEPQRILEHLSKLLDARALLTVTVKGSGKLFNSILVDINPTNGCFTLDKLFPESGHKLALKSGKLNIHTILNGIEISFNGVLISSVGNESDALYELALPEKLFYRQRRSTYRVPVSVAQGIQVTMFNKQEEPSQGILSNLSIGGLCAQFEKNTIHFPQEKGLRLPACRFSLPGGQKIETEFELCFFYQDTAYNTTRIGGKFLSLQQFEERDVQRYIMHLEREILKTRPE